MKTDVDTCLKDIADWFVKNRRNITPSDIQPILLKHCESVEEGQKLLKFLETEPGQLQFKTLLRERKEVQVPGGYPSLMCGQCGARFHTMKELNEHLKREHPEAYASVQPSYLKELAIAREVTVPGGSRWQCVKCGKILESGEKAVKIGAKVYCAQCIKAAKEKPSYLKELTKIDPAFGAPPSASYLKEPDEELRREVERGSYIVWNDPRTSERKQVYCAFPSDSAEAAASAAMVKEAVESHIKMSIKVSVIPIPKGGSSNPRVTLEEFLAETECQLISPQYYDILTWLNIPVPDYSFAIEPEVKERKIDEVLQKLKDGVARIHESPVFREFLITMAKFHDYSIGNQILIMMQRPTATKVAGFVTWKDLGRYVRAGEKGIAILAPCLPPTQLKCPICDKVFTEKTLRIHLSEFHQRVDVSELIKLAKEEAEAPIPTATYFKVVYVFDISQTEGKPLPEIAVPVLSGAYSEELYNKLMKLAAKHSLTVDFSPKPGLDPAIKGSLVGKSIWVKPDEPEAQRLKTLAHEVAHYFTEAVYFIPRAEAEVIAESVAFTICAHFGFDSGVRSFPYVALWAKEKKVLEQNLASVRKISTRIIEELS